MIRTIGNHLHQWRWFSGLLLGLAAGYAAGIAAQPSSTVHAEVTELPRREAFQAGGERSEIVLRDIAAILKRMDTRVERIEQAVTRGPAEAKRKSQ